MITSLKTNKKKDYEAPFPTDSMLKVEIEKKK
jgi:hypothetical protein